MPILLHPLVGKPWCKCIEFVSVMKTGWQQRSSVLVKRQQQSSTTPLLSPVSCIAFILQCSALNYKLTTFVSYLDWNDVSFAYLLKLLCNPTYSLSTQVIYEYLSCVFTLEEWFHRPKKIDVWHQTLSQSLRRCWRSGSTDSRKSTYDTRPSLGAYVEGVVWGRD